MRWIALLLAIVLCASPLSATPNPYRLLRSISVLQADGRNICSVTSINNDKKYYLTAAHCVLANFPFPGNQDPDMDKTFVAVPNANMSIDGHPAYLLDVNVDGDMAILFVPYANRPALRLSEKGVRYSDKITVAGHPLGWNQPTIFHGWVASPSLRFTEDFDAYPFNKFYMILQVAGAPGNSGSSVVNEAMKIVGIVQISWGRSFEPVLGASPYADLKAFAGKYFTK